MTRRKTPVWAALFLASSLVLAGSGRVEAPSAEAAEWAAVEHAIDGDTVRLSDGRRVRLIGINTPEYEPWRSHAEPYGKEAAQYASSLLDGTRVRLEYDRDRTDRYGRTLAYLYLPDGRSVNHMLVEEGYAKAIYVAPNGRYYRTLKAAERSARSRRKGLWAFAA